MSIQIHPCPEPCPVPAGPPKHHPSRKTMKIEAVITCVNYADYLEQTLPFTQRIFDWVSVVTSNDDKETLELCRRLSVPCYQTGKFKKGDSAFNKALGVNHGLKFLRYHDWVAHMDADTVLSPNAGYWLKKKALDPQKIYGCDRLNCKGWDAWQAYKAANHSGHDYDCRVHFPPNMALLDRISLVNDGGYVPIGYFQLWNVGKSGRHYPVHEGTYATAERTDVGFATQWDEEHRILLGEFFALHLTTKVEPPLGANWSGRTTPRFKPGA